MTRRKGVRILAIDVGVGTQDILLYDSAKTPENNIKMVLPSATQILAKRIRNSKGNLLFSGTTMGGGPMAMAINNHIKKGYRVVMTARAARSIRDNLREVEEMGIEIVGDKDARDYDFENPITRDIDFEFLKKTFEAVGERFEFDAIGIAVQDHGYSEHKSDRVFRFEKIKEVLEKGATLKDFGFENPPEYFTRMKAVLKTAREYYKGKVIVFDTKIAAIAGAIYGVKERPALSIDIGNGHTLAGAIDEEDKVTGMFEHHTGMLNKDKMEALIRRFVNGKLPNEEVYNDGGHGCYLKEKIEMRDIKRILATGPNRRLLEKSTLKIEFANPIGDVMMTGPVGIVDMVRARMER